jgi:dCTP deaminase
MTVLSAQTILKRKIITPCVPRTVVNGKTYGISAAGYDVRIDFSKVRYSARKMCRNRYNPSFDQGPPILDGDFLLAATLEHFNMPDDVMGIVHDKSSWARKGLTVQNTVIEPGWRGHLTLELTYQGPPNHEVMITHGDPIAQIVFHQLDEPTIFPYSGKYQDQEPGPQEAREES